MSITTYPARTATISARAVSVVRSQRLIAESPLIWPAKYSTVSSLLAAAAVKPTSGSTHVVGPSTPAADTVETRAVVAPLPSDPT